MAKYAITPWRHQKDLLEVCRQLYGDSERRHAVDRVMAWKLRGNLPHAVESTALLVDAILHHDIEGISIFSVRAVYSAAFSRFVTGFCDIGRNKERSLEPSSMLDIAKQIGMPPAFVALRHEATHEELPAIHRLVKATQEALDWLWNVYWSRLEEPESDAALAASLPKARSQAKEFFKSWRSARRDAVRTKNQRQQTEDVQSASKACLSLIKANGASSVLPRTHAVADVLIEDGLLLPSKREFGSSLSGAFLIWEGLLQDIIKQQKSFLNALVASSLSRIDQENARPQDDAHVEGICLWLLHMLDFAQTDAQRTKLRREIMQWCCTHPGGWSHYLGKRLLESSDADFVEDWKDVLDASQLQPSQEAAFVNDTEMADIQQHATVSDSSAQPLSWMWAVAATAAPIGIVR
ncbi:Pre-rRNA-processing protein las1 [Pseudocercospora fuligena]|uniref:Pre-rRNA-processing protein las1 n=1 Tax=Pseudocercospora fuligena TaxID=685502 RepID=A0A8H6VL45_9PEZI|nr:Pre-rRNA-processing protein las1 [Pseudocercospora fuligena]